MKNTRGEHDSNLFTESIEVTLEDMGRDMQKSAI